jgi:hypothetical protein
MNRRHIHTHTPFFCNTINLQTNHGKIQEQELMNRLMGIVGHLVQRRTLKVSCGLMEVNKHILGT